MVKVLYRSHRITSLHRNIVCTAHTTSIRHDHLSARQQHRKFLTNAYLYSMASSHLNNSILLCSTITPGQGRTAPWREGKRCPVCGRTCCAQSLDPLRLSVMPGS